MKELEYFSNIAKSLDIDLSCYCMPNSGYSRNIILCDDIEVIVLCWAKDTAAPFHYHQDSAVYTKLLSGKVEERILVPKDSIYYCKTIVLEKDQEFYLPPHSFHEVKVIEPAMMLNIYSPSISHKDQSINEELQNIINQYV